ncbi:BspA family leucine-rich repeat surface protein [Lactobacillus kullabergensis]|uniref:BspA family leucine-rich repeat surface protein n=1 Tax=Lactobacillus kullabergensis TaxID=1218493 RepID=UPI002246C40A|nr:BspA family leucine-rich repeat surface protein [Lactobacillus kullabergensis]MCX0292044.1 BspA family leucine-rich repeat surface protein [Lactobacillus kullabergensis]
MKVNHNIKKFTSKLLVSSAIAGILGGVAINVIPEKTDLVQNVQAKKKKRTKAKKNAKKAITSHKTANVNKKVDISKYSQDNDCILKFDPSTKTLHIKEDVNSNKLGSTPIYDVVYNAKKHVSKKNMFKPSNIEHISIDSNIALSDDSSYLFARLYNLQDIAGLDKVDTGKTEYVDHMFFKDKKLIQLDLSQWDASSFAYYRMENMFSGDTSLKEINVTGWGIKLSDDIFNGLDTTKVKIIGFDEDDEDDD